MSLVKVLEQSLCLGSVLLYFTKFENYKENRDSKNKKELKDITKTWLVISMT